MNRWFVATLLATAWGCVPDLSDQLDTQTEPTSVPEGSVLIDARSVSEWVGFDLDAAATADPEGPDWDLAFRRFNIQSNGGVTGDGGVEAVLLPAMTFEEVTEPPLEGWGVDLADDDGDGIDEYALETWYGYDYDTHLLAVTPGVWVVRSNLGITHKIAFQSYYNESGTPAMVSFQLAPLE